MVDDISLLEEIRICALDYIKNINRRFTSEDVTDYVIDLLSNFYDLKKYKKYIYPEFIEQIISQRFPYINRKFHFKLTEKSKERERNRVLVLKDKPQAKQRSKEWYEKRFNTIGASELASIFGKSPFTSYNKYFLKKLGYKPPPKENESLSIHCLHGVKYEDIAIMLYEKRNKVKIYEFGSIDDESIEFLAASPDGISAQGRMLEIKCPLSRKIIGIPPNYYWYQMQQQLKVCKLNSCDFLECKIVEYPSWNDFLEDNFNDNYLRNSLDLEKGVIIEYININETDPWNIFGYIYPPKLDMTCDEIYKWNNKIKVELEQDPIKSYARIIPWRLEQYSCITVFRNKSWWKENFHIVNEFWADVQFYRGIGYDSFIKPPLKKQPKNKLNDEYLFLSDSDSD